MEQIINFLLDEQTVYFSSILLLNIISSCIGTLKQIYTSKQAGKITYIMVLIDAIVYSLVLKSFSSEGVAAIMAYVIGKLIGAVMADVVEKKIAIGINDIDLYVGEYEEMIGLQKTLMENGYSTTANVGLINDVSPRYYLNVQVARKDMNNFMKLLNGTGITDPTMTVQELKKVSGKIAKRV